MFQQVGEQWGQRVNFGLVGLAGGLAWPVWLSHICKRRRLSGLTPHVLSDLDSEISELRLWKGLVFIFRAAPVRWALFGSEIEKMALQQ